MNSSNITIWDPCKYLMASNKNIDTYRWSVLWRNIRVCAREHRRVLVIGNIYWFVECSHTWYGCDEYARGSFTEINTVRMFVCFYHNFEFYLCCELCGGDNDNDNYVDVFSYDFYFVLVKQDSPYGIARKHIKLTAFVLALWTSTNNRILSFSITCICSMNIDSREKRGRKVVH